MPPGVSIGKKPSGKSNQSSANCQQGAKEIGKGRNKTFDLSLKLKQLNEDSKQTKDHRVDPEIEETAIDHAFDEADVSKSCCSTKLMNSKRVTSHSLASHKSYYTGAWHGECETLCSQSFRRTYDSAV